MTTVAPLMEFVSRPVDEWCHVARELSIKDSTPLIPVIYRLLELIRVSKVPDRSEESIRSALQEVHYEHRKSFAHDNNKSIEFHHLVYGLVQVVADTIHEITVSKVATVPLGAMVTVNQDYGSRITVEENRREDIKQEVIDAEGSELSSPPCPNIQYTINNAAPPTVSDTSIAHEKTVHNVTAVPIGPMVAVNQEYGSQITVEENRREDIKQEVVVHEGSELSSPPGPPKEYTYSSINNSALSTISDASITSRPIEQATVPPSSIDSVSTCSDSPEDDEIVILSSRIATVPRKTKVARSQPAKRPRRPQANAQSGDEDVVKNGEASLVRRNNHNCFVCEMQLTDVYGLMGHLSSAHSLSIMECGGWCECKCGVVHHGAPSLLLHLQSTVCTMEEVTVLYSLQKLEEAMRRINVERLSVNDTNARGTTRPRIVYDIPSSPEPKKRSPMDQFLINTLKLDKSVVQTRNKK